MSNQGNWEAAHDQAEEALRLVASVETTDNDTLYDQVIAKAQVHATLAMAYATMAV